MCTRTVPTQVVKPAHAPMEAPSEQNLFGEEARLGSEWPTEHDDTTRMKRGYYCRDNGPLGKVIDSVKLTESEDDYSSSHSAKHAKMNFCASESDPDVGSPRVGATKVDNDSEKSGEGDDEKNDEEKVDEKKNDNVEDDEESEPFILKNVCRQTVGIDDNGNKEECGGETNGCSQMCHSCKQAMKRGWFAYGFMR